MFCLSFFQNFFFQYLRKCYRHWGDLVSSLVLAILLFFLGWLVFLVCCQTRYVLGCSSTGTGVCCLLFFPLCLFYNLYVFLLSYSLVLNSAFFVPLQSGNSVRPKPGPYAVCKCTVVPCLTNTWPQSSNFNPGISISLTFIYT